MDHISTQSIDESSCRAMVALCSNACKEQKVESILVSCDELSYCLWDLSRLRTCCPVCLKQRWIPLYACYLGIHLTGHIRHSYLGIVYLEFPCR